MVSTNESGDGRRRSLEEEEPGRGAWGRSVEAGRSTAQTSQTWRSNPGVYSRDVPGKRNCLVRAIRSDRLVEQRIRLSTTAACLSQRMARREQGDEEAGAGGKRGATWSWQGAAKGLLE